MRAPSIYARRRTGLDIPMTPLIDVVFQLLVFFLLTASFHAAEHLLPSSVSAPQASGAGSALETPLPEQDFDEVVVRILWKDDQPAWQINGQTLASLQEVRNTLAAVAEVKADAPVILHPDPDVPLGHVIDVYDVTRLVGFPQVRFAASGTRTSKPAR
jgi:biopolymer transport protein ExbD